MGLPLAAYVSSTLIRSAHPGFEGHVMQPVPITLWHSIFPLFCFLGWQGLLAFPNFLPFEKKKFFTFVIRSFDSFFWLWIADLTPLLTNSFPLFLLTIFIPSPLTDRLSTVGKCTSPRDSIAQLSIGAHSRCSWPSILIGPLPMDVGRWLLSNPRSHFETTLVASPTRN